VPSLPDQTLSCEICQSEFTFGIGTQPCVPAPAPMISRRVAISKERHGPTVGAKARVSATANCGKADATVARPAAVRKVVDASCSPDVNGYSCLNFASGLGDAHSSSVGRGTCPDTACPASGVMQ
jgi:hypothetical protein